MATKKDNNWRRILDQFSEIKILSGKWLNHKPTIEEFGLEDYNLNALYRSKEKFEDDKNARIEAIAEEMPPPKVRGTFTWEGYVAIAFMMGMVAYQAFSKNPTFLVFGFIAIGALFFFFLYYYRLRKKQRDNKKKIEELGAEQIRISTERFEYDDAYDSLVEYAKAVFDYEAWERRRRPSAWKKFTEDKFMNEIISMLRTYGYDAFLAERRGLSIIYEYYDDEERHALYCSTKKQITEKISEDFMKSMERNHISDGIIVSMTGYTKEARQFCNSNDIGMWTLDDILSLEKDVEETALEEEAAKEDDD